MISNMNFHLKITGAAMYVINFSYYVSADSFRKVTDSDFVDGLDLYHRNYQADSKLLNLLDKLIFLRSIAFGCRYWNGSHNVNYRLEGTGQAYQYFALNSDERPAADSMTLTSDFGRTDFTLAGGKFSYTSGVNAAEKRLYKKVFKSSEEIDFDISTKTCFYNPGSWTLFYVQVW